MAASFPTRTVPYRGTIGSPIGVSPYTISTAPYPTLTEPYFFANNFFGLNYGFANFPVYGLNPQVITTPQCALVQWAGGAVSAAGSYFYNATLDPLTTYRALGTAANGLQNGYGGTFFLPSQLASAGSYTDGSLTYTSLSYLTCPTIQTEDITASPQVVTYVETYNQTSFLNAPFAFPVYDYLSRRISTLVNFQGSVEGGDAIGFAYILRGASPPEPYTGEDAYGNEVWYGAPHLLTADHTLVGAIMVDPYNGNCVANSNAYSTPFGPVCGSIYNSFGPSGEGNGLIAWQYLALEREADNAAIYYDTSYYACLVPAGGFLFQGIASGGGSATGTYYLVLRDFSGYFVVNFHPQNTIAGDVMAILGETTLTSQSFGVDLNGNFWKIGLLTGSQYALVGNFNYSRQVNLRDFPSIAYPSIGCRTYNKTTAIWEG